MSLYERLLPPPLTTRHPTTTTTQPPQPHTPRPPNHDPPPTPIPPAGQLLDHIGGNVNPLIVIQKIPAGMEIPHLRDRLRAIISDFRTQTSLREGCNAVLASDCRHLIARLQREARRALATVYLHQAPGDALAGGGAAGGGRGGGWVRYQASGGRPVTQVAAGDVPDVGGGGGGQAPAAVAIGMPCRVADQQADEGGGGVVLAAAAALGGVVGASQAAQRRVTKRAGSGRGAATQLPSLVVRL